MYYGHGVIGVDYLMTCNPKEDEGKWMMGDLSFYVIKLHHINNNEPFWFCRFFLDSMVHW
jgi:hypothetical protein